MSMEAYVKKNHASRPQPTKRYITYDESGVVRRHRFLFTAQIIAKKNKTTVDLDNGKFISTIKDYQEY